jgi:GH35 family endo-1,4-beta-xylanase
VEASKFRFDVKREESNTLVEVNRLIIEQERLRSNFKSPDAHANFVTPHKLVLDSKDAELEYQKLRVMNGHNSK